MAVEESSSLDRINMTKNWLEYDQKKFAQTNLKVGAWPKIHTNEHKTLYMTKIWIYFRSYSHVKVSRCQGKGVIIDHE